MSLETVIVALIGYIIAREAFFLYTTHKLINKVMSHSFHDYTQSIKSLNSAPQTQPTRVQEEVPEDLGSLQEIGMI